MLTPRKNPVNWTAVRRLNPWSCIMQDGKPNSTGQRTQRRIANPNELWQQCPVDDHPLVSVYAQAPDALSSCIAVTNTLSHSASTSLLSALASHQHTQSLGFHQPSVSTCQSLELLTPLALTFFLRRKKEWEREEGREGGRGRERKKHRRGGQIQSK